MTAKRTEETETEHCIYHPTMEIKVNWGLKIGGGIFLALIGIFATIFYQTVVLVPEVKNDLILQMAGIKSDIAVLQKVTSNLQSQLDDVKGRTVYNAKEN